MYDRVVRPLAEAEERRLRRRLARHRLPLSSPWRWLVGVGLAGVLWGLTVLTSGLLLWPTVVWVVMAILMPVWIGWDEHRSDAARRRAIESALAADRVEELRVATTEAVAFEEVEDLGEVWAFQVEPGRLLFLGPRQDLPRGFPTTDFTYAEIRDARGNVVDARFKLRGEALTPVRRISADAQRGLELPHDRELLEGRLERLESLVSSATPASTRARVR